MIPTPLPGSRGPVVPCVQVSCPAELCPDRTGQSKTTSTGSGSAPHLSSLTRWQSVALLLCHQLNTLESGHPPAMVMGLHPLLDLAAGAHRRCLWPAGFPDPDFSYASADNPSAAMTACAMASAWPLPLVPTPRRSPTDARVMPGAPAQLLSSRRMAAAESLPAGMAANSFVAHCVHSFITGVIIV